MPAEGEAHAPSAIEDILSADDPNGSNTTSEQIVIISDDNLKKDEEPVDSVNPAAKDGIIPTSDLRRPDRRIWVVTTAALPWRTGTSVNPLARALYLTRGRPKFHVTLLVPWLPKKHEQIKLFGENCTFNEQADQEKWLRQYCINRVNCEKEADNLRIQFYPATYNAPFGSIFATVDICSLIPEEEADVAILEEPEHLNWFRVPPATDVITDPISKEKTELGWAIKFNHVVGILHTNYAAYMDQYGMGAAFIASSALNAMSTLVVKAYCHRLIRLSGTLPHLDKEKEVTCNVHGVRSEFFDPPKVVEQTNSFNPIYFIGKVIWAKGFDKLLEIQEAYKNVTGEYFAIDVYGSGENETAIKRAFLGRKGFKNQKLEAKESGDSIASESGDSVGNPPDRAAAMVFSKTGSIKSQLESGESGDSIEVVYNDGSSSENLERDNQGESFPNPFGIIGDISSSILGTGVTTALAGEKVVENVIDLGICANFSEEDGSDIPPQSALRQLFDNTRKKGLKFDPPKSRFELRRNPIPARFLGVKDHALIRDSTEHKIFINPSKTEVLCTTTAEALAMGKFVIIPKHPSNEFFLKFPNCLAYNDKKDCVDKLKWALQNDPKPLSQEEAYYLSWEGANERLFDSSAITEAEMKKRRDSGKEKSDRDAARLHVESVTKARNLQKFLKR